MSDEPMKVDAPTSPDLAANDGILRTVKDFSNVLTTELTDDEIGKAFAIVVDIQSKYAHRANTVENLEFLRDEVTTRLAEVGVLVSIDPTPCFYGEAPIVDFLGKVAGDAIHTHGFDHEKKEWEVRRATERGEDFLGQKGN